MLAVLAVGLVSPGLAEADGDPGSDVLLAQSSFLPPAAGLTAQQEVGIARLLAAAESAGAPVRVAVIPRPSDLGVYSHQLWLKPQQYADLLGYELSENYAGRLLVVMPNGFGVYWSAKLKGDRGPDEMATALQTVRVRAVTGAPLVRTITAAVDHLESAAGLSPGRLSRDRGSAGDGRRSGAGGRQATAAPGNGSPRSAGSTSNGRSGSEYAILIVAAAGLLIVLVLAYALMRGTERDGRRRPRPGGGAFGGGITPFAIVPVGFLAIVVGVLLVGGGGSGSGISQAQAAAENSGLDTGSVLTGNRTAPNFTLYNQDGRPISLKQYRGKVVILSFIDAECQTLCPLTTQAMLDAKRSLGPAAKDVELLGVNANFKSTQIQDVLTYTQEHGMVNQWNFLTSPDDIAKLEKVWTAYGVDEFSHEDGITSNDINHVAATFLIDPHGKLRRVFLTQANYAAIPQFGQLLARDASALLPGHPKVDTDYSYAPIRGITPDDTTTLPKVGGGTVTLGPGKPHLYVFFDTWDLDAGLTANLEKLNQYAAAAKRDGLPSLTAIDEGSVEPNASALPDYLKTLPAPLRYPVAIDNSGRVADGYDVEGEPWFVLVSATGQIVWYQEVYTQSWPGIAQIKQQGHGDLTHVPNGVPTASEVGQELGGSPGPLAELHRQSSQLLPGGVRALKARMRSLHGFPIVVNIWASTCGPCQSEVPLFQNASAEFGKNVAFIGVDTDAEPTLGRIFMRDHPVSYPSYGSTDVGLDSLLPGGLQGTPTTLFYTANGHLTIVPGSFRDQATLDTAIEVNALGPDGCTACR